MSPQFLVLPGSLDRSDGITLLARGDEHEAPVAPISVSRVLTGAAVVWGPPQPASTPVTPSARRDERPDEIATTVGAKAARLADTMARMADLSTERAVVLVYSQRPEVRAAVRSAVGRRPSAQSPRIEWVEASTDRELTIQLDAGDVDLAILDGEAQPTGGMGLARQFKNELTDCPPILVLIARKQDAWLASWSLADATVPSPIDPVDAAAAVAALLDIRLSGVPVVR